MFPLKAEEERGFARFGGLYGQSKVGTIYTLVEEAFRGEPSLGPGNLNWGVLLKDFRANMSECSKL